MDILVTSVEVCLPLLFLVALGVLLRKLKMISDTTIKEVSKLILNLFLPINIFMNIYNGNIRANFSVGYLVILTSIFFVMAVLSTVLILLFNKDRKERSSMLQAAIRSNMSLFAVPLAGQIAGEEAMALTAVCASILAAAHTFYAVGEFEYFENRNANFVRLLINILKSPTVIATVLGFIFVFTGIKLPNTINTMCSYISRSVVAFSLVMIGASFNFALNIKKVWKVMYCVAFKTVICPVLAIAMALFVRMNTVQMVTLLTLFAAPCATSCYAQAVVYDTDMDIVSSSLVYSYVACIVTLPIFISILKFKGLI